MPMTVDAASGNAARRRTVRSSVSRLTSSVSRLTFRQFQVSVGEGKKGMLLCDMLLKAVAWDHACGKE
jgi:hypothetical protein